MRIFCSKLIQKSFKKPTSKFSMFLKMLNNTSKFGLTMNHFGLLILKKYMRNLAMILPYGKIFLTKSDRIVKLSITVKLRDISVQ